MFQADAGSEGNVRRLYQLARKTTRGFESYARRLRKRYSDCPQLLEDMLDGLFHIAASDGAATYDELVYIELVGELFGLSVLTFRQLQATHLGAASDDPYVILGVAPDVPNSMLRKAWKAQLSEAHPD